MSILITALNSENGRKRSTTEQSLSAHNAAKGAFSMSATRNQDIKSLVQQIDLINVEIIQSASSAVSGIVNHDLERWKAYNQGLRNYHAFVIAQPSPLDLPRVNPATMPVADPVVHEETGNTLANALVRLYVSARVEILECQSSAISSGLIPADGNRFVAVLDKADQLLKLGEDTPYTDLVETLPGNLSADVKGARVLQAP